MPRRDWIRIPSKGDLLFTPGRLDNFLLSFLSVSLFARNRVAVLSRFMHASCACACACRDMETSPYLMPTSIFAVSLMCLLLTAHTCEPK